MTRRTEGPPPVAYDLPGAAAAVALSESHLRRQIHSGKLRARRIDRKYRIAHADLVDWFNGLPEAPTYLDGPFPLR